MEQNTNISLVQLIKSGDVSVRLEIDNVQAQKEVNIYVRQYLNKSPDYLDIKTEINRAREMLQQASSGEKMFFAEKLNNLYKIEKDFIINALLLGKLFSEIAIRTERLKRAIQLFEEGKIKEADATLKADDLLNDQFNLFVFVEYQEMKMKLLENEH